MCYPFRLPQQVLLLLAGCLLLWTGCQNYELRNSACDNCISEKPDTGDFIVKFSASGDHTAIPFMIIDGDYETGHVVIADTAVSTEMTYQLEARKNYTVAASYMVDGKVVTVINTGKIKTRQVGCSDSNSDDATYYCWYVIPAEVDIRLK